MPPAAPSIVDSVKASAPPVASGLPKRSGAGPTTPPPSSQPAKVDANELVEVHAKLDESPCATSPSTHLSSEPSHPSAYRPSRTPEVSPAATTSGLSLPSKMLPPSEISQACEPALESATSAPAVEPSPGPNVGAVPVMNEDPVDFGVITKSAIAVTEDIVAVDSKPTCVVSSRTGDANGKHLHHNEVAMGEALHAANSVPVSTNRNAIPDGVEHCSGTEKTFPDASKEGAACVASTSSEDIDKPEVAPITATPLDEAEEGEVLEDASGAPILSADERHDVRLTNAEIAEVGKGPASKAADSVTVTPQNVSIPGEYESNACTGHTRGIKTIPGPSGGVTEKDEKKVSASGWDGAQVSGVADGHADHPTLTSPNVNASNSQSSDESESSSSSSDSEGEEGEDNVKEFDKIQEETRKQLDEAEKADGADATNEVVILSKNEVKVDTLEVKPIDVTISDNDVLYPTGVIHAIMKKEIIVRTEVTGEQTRPTWAIEEIEKAKALNIDSLLCFEDRTPLGRVFDTMCQVRAPMYIVRFNSEEEIAALPRAVVGAPVFYVEKYSELVYGKQIHSKGYDSSNMHDEESNTVEYSDDEEERAARKRKAHAARMANGEGDERHPSKQHHSDRPSRGRRGGMSRSPYDNRSRGPSAYNPGQYEIPRGMHGNRRGRGGYDMRDRARRSMAAQQFMGPGQHMAPQYGGIMMHPQMMPGMMPGMMPHHLAGMQAPPQMPMPPPGFQSLPHAQYGQVWNGQGFMPMAQGMPMAPGMPMGQGMAMGPGTPRPGYEGANGYYQQPQDWHNGGPPLPAPRAPVPPPPPPPEMYRTPGGQGPNGAPWLKQEEKEM